MIDTALAAKLFAALFAIMNPLSIMPIFLALTAGLNPGAKRRALVAMIMTVAIGSGLGAVAGDDLLALFGIDVAHFRLAGGLIVLMIALSMLNGDANASHEGSAVEQRQQQAASNDNPGIYPLGLPLAFGPGTMATIIVFAQSAQRPEQIAGFYAGLIGYLLFFAVAMALAPVVGARLSPTALSISKRLMGIILAAIAMEMIGGALGVMFPGWMH